MGEYLSTPNTYKDTRTGGNDRVRFAAGGMQGWRKSMEDSDIADVDIGDGCSLFGVFDGHGGQEVALFVKEHFKKELVKLQSFKSKCYKEALEECFFKMDVMMESEAGQRKLSKIQKAAAPGDFVNDKSYAGCTATVVLITPNEILCANAGDSRTVLSKNGTAVALSVDHKPDDKEELSRIQKAGGFVEDGRVNGILALSRALGDFEYKTNKSLPSKEQAVSALPDVKTVPITSDTEFILLACDGVWDVKTSQEGITFMNNKIYKKSSKPSAADLQNGLNALLDDCCAKDLASSEGLGCDNITAIFVEIVH